MYCMTKLNKQEELVILYEKWFMLWRKDPDRDYHFHNIILNIQRDIDEGNLTKNGKYHKMLQEFFANLKENNKENCGKNIGNGSSN